MAVQTDNDFKTFTAGEALEAYRRVKLDTGSGTNVVYADAGAEFIGITQNAVASGENVALKMRHGNGSYKVTASEAFDAASTLYGAADGKVADSASGNAQGTALEAATAAGDIVECIFDNAASAEIDGASVAIEAEAGNGAVPLIFPKTGITDANASNATIVTAPFKLKIINWWIISRDTGAANIKLVNDGSDATGTTAKGSSDDAIVAGGDLIAEQDEVASGDVLAVNASAVQSFDVFVEAIKIS